MSIEQLINDCKKNDIKAQEQLYRQYAPKLFYVCLKYSRNYTDAQDNLQDGFILIFGKIHLYSFKGSFDGWLKRVMINHVLQLYRKETFLSLVNEEITEAVDVILEDEETVSLDYLIKIKRALDKFDFDVPMFIFNMSAIS